MPIVSKIVCPLCGCCCDDIEVIVENNQIVDIKNACALSMAKFKNINHRNNFPMVRKNGKLVKVKLDEAVKKSAEILVKASYPLFYGWSSTSCEAIRYGLEIAEKVGGVIDNTSTICHGPSALAMQDMGLPTCTLGEIRHRADLIFYWGTNPYSSHPRHIERYTFLSEGRFQKSIWKRISLRLNAESLRKKIARVVGLISGKEFSIKQVKSKFFLENERKVIVVDVQKTHSAKIADYFLQVKPGSDYEILEALRALIKNEDLDVEEIAGIPVETLENLSDLMINCKFGIIFFGLGMTMSRGKVRNVDAAISLTRDLNERTKFSIMPMRGHFNVTGAETVFTWQTGYPYAVDFSKGYPRYNPGETSAVDILRRGDSDATFIVSSDPVSNFPKESVQNLIKNPSIVIDPHISLSASLSDVVIPSTFVGIETEGTIYRMDHVPLPLKKIVDPPKNCFSDLVILKKILKEIVKLKHKTANGKKDNGIKL
jgi:formylmethanofuran dehydrogenase subunit B